MKNLTEGSGLRSTIKQDVLPRLQMDSERHINKKIIDLIEAQGGEYVDDFYEIDSGTWCLYFLCKYEEMYQMNINSNTTSDDYGVTIYNINLDRITRMTYATSLLTLLEDPDIGIHLLLYKS